MVGGCNSRGHRSVALRLWSRCMTIVSRKPAPISTELEKGLLRSIFTIYWYRCGWFITKASGLALGILILFFNAATLTAAWADSGCTGLSALSQTYTVTNGV